MSWSRMSNIFRDSESFGKSNGKKWSQIWTFLFENCLKSPPKKKFSSSLFSVFFGFRSFLTVFLPPLPKVRCPIFLEIQNPWGKTMERSGLRYEHFFWKLSKIAAQKKVFFFTFFGLLRFSVFFKGLFAPISWSLMSNILRDSESLGKNNGKNWSNIWTFLFGSGLKSPREKKFFFADFALVHPPMASVLLSASVKRCFVSRMRDFYMLRSWYTPISNDQIWT